MPWTPITPPEATLSLKASGKIEWNSSLQHLLSNPEWVFLVWDASQRWLGIRGHNRSGGGFPVTRDEAKSLFSIDSGEALTNAGVPLSAHSESPPTKWATDLLDPLFNDWYQVYHITLPE
jgi:hypothetical protein